MSLKSRFCAKCGSESDRLVGNLCVECYIQMHPITVPSTKRVVVCSKCGSVRLRGFWCKSSKSEKEILSDQVRKSILFPPKVNIVKVDVLEQGKKGVLDVVFEVAGDVLSKRYERNISFNKRLCSECRRKSIVNYKAKLQLRLNESVEKHISDSIKFMRKYKKSIIRIVDCKKGIDVHFRSKKACTTLSKELKNEFNFKMKVTHEQYSWNKNKNRPKYKTVVLLKEK